MNYKDLIVTGDKLRMQTEPKPVWYLLRARNGSGSSSSDERDKRVIFDLELVQCFHTIPPWPFVVLSFRHRIHLNKQTFAMM